MTPQLYKQTKLRRVDPAINADRVYILNMYINADGEYTLFALHGRHSSSGGNSLRKIGKIEFPDNYGAVSSEMQSIVDEKLRKGYEIESENTFTLGQPSTATTRKTVDKKARTNQFNSNALLAWK